MINEWSWDRDEEAPGPKNTRPANATVRHAPESRSEVDAGGRVIGQSGWRNVGVEGFRGTPRSSSLGFVAHRMRRSHSDRRRRAGDRRPNSGAVLRRNHAPKLARRGARRRGVTCLQLPNRRIASRAVKFFGDNHLNRSFIYPREAGLRCSTLLPPLIFPRNVSLLACFPAPAFSDVPCPPTSHDVLSSLCLLSPRHWRIQVTRATSTRETTLPNFASTSSFRLDTQTRLNPQEALQTPGLSGRSHSDRFRPQPFASRVLEDGLKPLSIPPSLSGATGREKYHITTRRTKNTSCTSNPPRRTFTLAMFYSSSFHAPTGCPLYILIPQ